MGNKWVKSQKIVDFPLRDFDPTNYLASVPRQTILIHKAELEGVDPATYIANLQEKDNVFLEIVPENKVNIFKHLLDIYEVRAHAGVCVCVCIGRGMSHNRGTFCFMVHP